MDRKIASAPAAGISGNVGFRQMWKVCGDRGIGIRAGKIAFDNMRDPRLDLGRFF